MIKDYYTLFTVPGNSEHARVIDEWMRHNPSTRFQYILDRELIGKTYNLKLTKTLYPGVKVLATVINPWSRFYKLYTQLNSLIDINTVTHVLCNNIHSKLRTTQFESIFFESEGFELDFVFRSECIDKDFNNFKNHLTDKSIPIQFKNFNFDHKHLFDKKSQDIIREIYRKDFEYFNYIDYL